MKTTSEMMEIKREMVYGEDKMNFPKNYKTAIIEEIVKGCEKINITVDIEKLWKLHMRYLERLFTKLEYMGVSC